MAEKKAGSSQTGAGIKRKTFEELFGKKKDSEKKGAVNNARDLYWQYTDANGNTTDYSHALQRSWVHDDPMEFACSGRRDMRKNIENGKKNRKNDNEKARNAAIDSRLEDTKKAMDARGTDQLSMMVNGYNMVFMRSPKENGAESITVNGEKAYVQEQLPVGTAGRVAGKMQVSMDMVDEALERGPESGVICWKKKLPGGEKVRIDAMLQAGGRVVGIDKSLSGDEIKIIPEKMQVSPDLWQEGYGRMREFGRDKWMMMLDDDRVTMFGYEVKVNGKEASVTDKENVSEINVDAENPVVSSRLWEKLYDDMLLHESKTTEMTMKDGTKLSARLIMKVDGMNASIGKDLTGTETKRIPEKVMISPQRWEEVKSGILEASQRGEAYKGILPDASILEGRLSVKVNGREAVPNFPMMEGEIRKEEGRTVISKDLYDSLKEGAGNKTIHEMELGDGTRLGIRREAELTAAARSGKGVEIFKGDDLREAVAEADAMNTDTVRDVNGKFFADGLDQAGLSFERSIGNIPNNMVSGAIRKPGEIYKEERREAKNAADGILKAGNRYLDKGVSLGR